jgi:hypothetical protein
LPVVRGVVDRRVLMRGIDHEWHAHAQFGPELPSAHRSATIRR